MNKNRTSENQKTYYTHNEIVNTFIGHKGTPARNKYDAEIKMFLIGEAIKRARLDQNLTQEQLGKMIGVQKAQISRLEHGENLTFATVSKVFRAMGLSAELDISNVGKVALC